jgi:hypothetical protein
MKTRRHHNNRGARQIKRGRTRRQVEEIAKRLGVPYGSRSANFSEKIGGPDASDEQTPRSGRQDTETD